MSRFGSLLDVPVSRVASAAEAEGPEDLSHHDENMVRVLRSAAQRRRAETSSFFYLPTVEEVYRAGGCPEEGLLSEDLTSHALFLCNSYTAAAEDNLRSLREGSGSGSGSGPLPPLVGLSSGGSSSALAQALRQERSLWRLLHAVLRVLPLLARVIRDKVGQPAAGVAPQRLGNATPLGEGLVLEREEAWGPSLQESCDPQLMLLGVLLDWLHANARDDATALLQQANEVPREGRASLAAAAAPLLTSTATHAPAPAPAPAAAYAAAGGAAADMWRLARCGRLLLRGAPRPADSGMGALELAKRRGVPWLAAALCSMGMPVDELVEGGVRRRGNPSSAATEAAAAMLAASCAAKLREAGGAGAALGSSSTGSGSGAPALAFEAALMSTVLAGQGVAPLVAALGSGPSGAAGRVLGTWEDVLWVAVVAAAAARSKELEGGMARQREWAAGVAERTWAAPPLQAAAGSTGSSSGSSSIGIGSSSSSGSSGAYQQPPPAAPAAPRPMEALQSVLDCTRPSPGTPMLPCLSTGVLSSPYVRCVAALLTLAVAFCEEGGSSHSQAQAVLHYTHSLQHTVCAALAAAAPEHLTAMQATQEGQQQQQQQQQQQYHHYQQQQQQAEGSELAPFAPWHSADTLHPPPTSASDPPATAQLPPHTTPLLRWAALSTTLLRTHSPLAPCRLSPSPTQPPNPLQPSEPPPPLTSLLGALSHPPTYAALAAPCDDLLLAYARHLAAAPDRLTHCEAVVELCLHVSSRARLVRALTAYFAALPYVHTAPPPLSSLPALAGGAAAAAAAAAGAPGGEWQPPPRLTAITATLLARSETCSDLWAAHRLDILSSVLRHTVGLYLTLPPGAATATATATGAPAFQRATCLPLPEPLPHLPVAARDSGMLLPDFARLTALELLGCGPGAAWGEVGGGGGGGRLFQWGSAGSTGSSLSSGCVGGSGSQLLSAVNSLCREFGGCIVRQALRPEGGGGAQLAADSAAAALTLLHVGLEGAGGEAAGPSPPATGAGAGAAAAASERAFSAPVDPILCRGPFLPSATVAAVLAGARAMPVDSPVRAQLLAQGEEVRLWRALAHVLVARKEWQQLKARVPPPPPSSHTTAAAATAAAAAAGGAAAPTTGQEATARHAALRLREARRRHLSTVCQLWGGEVGADSRLTGLEGAATRYYSALCMATEAVAGEGRLGTPSLLLALTAPGGGGGGAAPAAAPAAAAACYPFASTVLFEAEDPAVTPLALEQAQAQALAQAAEGGAGLAGPQGSHLAAAHTLRAQLCELCLSWLQELAYCTCAWVLSDELAYAALGGSRRHLGMWMELLKGGTARRLLGQLGVGGGGSPALAAMVAQYNELAVRHEGGHAARLEELRAKYREVLEG